ncbi:MULTISPECIES: antiviral reverse transcriptase Drt3a [Glaesserella]|uniref:Reverse transcriptase domain-containing protein n=1 Tax=Glaesserella australis TaxID=2094024 RepID=A0A328C2C3_9PAST|nr:MULTISPECIES: antiviral reverse transcriptase Drt3a [Glaesserella]AUI66490.1 hypothetical protein CJD39_07835 [Glaesserella sp. 15-184]RAL18664.1 hypothetical protein C5N92_05855 [Glaesserella australis]
MRYQDYNHHTLSRFFYPIEISSFNGQSDKKKIIIETAIKNLYGKVEDNFYITLMNKKVVFYSHDLSFNILYRKITGDLLKLYESRTPSRNEIIKSLLSVLRESFPYKLFKLDIASFYESFDKEKLMYDIHNLKELSTFSKNFILFTLNTCNKKVQEDYPVISVSLPRGVSFSGTIANIFMSDFDNYVKNNSNIFYYSRFVDDIIIVSNKEVDDNHLLNKLQEKLYDGLIFNEKKKFISESTSDFTFDYLGYSIHKSTNLTDVGNTFKSKKEYYKLEVTMSSKKINKIKGRISRCLLEYLRDRNEELLIDRLRFLASNKYIRDKKTLKRRINGIRYSYPLLTNDSALDELDKFMLFLLYSGKSRLSVLIKNNLSAKLKKKITHVSFKRFYNNNVFFSFSPLKIIKIQRCWKYE